MLIKHKINNNQNNQHFYKKDEIFNNYLGAFKVILTYIYVNSLILCLDCIYQTRNNLKVLEANTAFKAIRHPKNLFFSHCSAPPWDLN
ncbi:hypothetical protein H8356DRAFT_1436185 [Neocallimastix lanati (nom. inval.)]|nr:hypothetical protein H8356DRAFT_1436185 [Neocallimastix sp. JGI-2020a]